jgi:1-acyl-sn-glycerol-3-phosphate acyltransferase
VNSLGRIWRGFGTALFLGLVGLGGTLMTLTVFPLVAAVVRTPERRHRAFRRIMHLAFRAYCAAIHGSGIARIEFVEAHRLKSLRGHLLIANHPSLLDVVMIIASVPNVQCIVKSALWRHPFFRLTVRGAGFIRNDLEPEALMRACQDALGNGQNLIIFPEGTRTSPGASPRMQRGFANLAIHARANLQLLTITCTPPILFKGNPWWHVPERRSHFRLSVGEQVDIEEYLGYPYRTLGARKLMAFVENYYMEQLTDGRPGEPDQVIDRHRIEAGGYFS